MSASQALFQVLIGGLAGASSDVAWPLAAALLTLAATAAYIAFVVPQLPPRAGIVLSIALALGLLGASWALLSLASTWWPVAPTVVALAFGHLGIRAGRTPRRVPLPPRAAPRAAPVAKAAGAPESQPASRPATQAPDRATLGRYRI
ncbi:MAG TPA: hypothetical protein VJ608_06555, partial [Albitalea sp.]|nr:hypothetical protein [Albitalea sp.]